MFATTLLMPLILAASPQDPPIPADTTIQTTASGLQYSVLQAGRPGPQPKLGDKVMVHYTGWLADGKVFDSSRKRGDAASFVLGRVIPGWNEGLQLMTPGARYKFTIPPALGYGDRGAPPRIPGKATLIFEVELIDVVAMPVLQAANPEAQKITPSGLKYEFLAEGAGESPADGAVYEFDYAIFNPAGKLVDCSEMGNGPIKGGAGDMRLPFLNEVLPLMKAGAHLRCEVPAALAFGAQGMGPGLPANSNSIWQLRMRRVLRPLPVPAFALSPAEAMQKTDSGLQYETLQAGAGAAPKLGQRVRVHYAGWLLDGTLFDSSYGRGEPAEFRLGEVIPGWNEGLTLMQEGAVYKFTIPAELAYGKQGAPPKIGPNQTLVFLVELQQVLP